MRESGKDCQVKSCSPVQPIIDLSMPLPLPNTNKTRPPPSREPNRLKHLLSRCLIRMRMGKRQGSSLLSRLFYRRGDFCDGEAEGHLVVFEEGAEGLEGRGGGVEVEGLVAI